jgi:hypothetical protein
LSSYKQKSFIKIVGGQFSFPFVLTARQYGEVVLPDASIGQGPRTPRQRGHKAVTVQACLTAAGRQGGYGALFAIQVQILPKHYECRGTNLIGATNLSPVTKFLAGTGAVSRYKVDRSQKFVKVQEFNCVQMRVSGCNSHYEFVLGAGAKAKSVTNNLPILSVLWLVSL